MHVTLRSLIILVVLIVTVLLSLWMYIFQGSGIEYDADELAAAETRMWKAYYSEDIKTLRLELKATLRHQFGLSRYRSTVVAARLSMASAAFILSRGGATKESVITDIEKAYKDIKNATGLNFNTREAAEAELYWWVARRTPGKNSVEEVGKGIAKLYAILYGKTNPDIEYAGYLRAEAARVRDLTSDYVEVESLLRESYAYLLIGIGK